MRIPAVVSTLVLAFVTLLAASAAREAGAFNAVVSDDGRDVIAVGDSGLVYRSANSGVLWSSRNLGSRALRGIAHRGFVVIAVGDSGKIWRSVDNGGGWALQVVGGTPDLFGISMPEDSIGYVVGDGGIVLKSTDAGANWSPQNSGAAARLRAVKFRDALHGWAVGDGGAALHTDDGGATWVAAAVGTSRDLLGVDFRDPTVWVVGREGTALRSDDRGSSWNAVNLRLEPGTDVGRVWLDASSRATLVGGGGFLRRTADGGATWSFLRHEFLGEIGDLYFLDDDLGGWACARRQRVVMRTSDGGATWTLPQSTQTVLSWLQRIPTPFLVRGTTLGRNMLLPDEFYVVLGRTLYRSPDRGTEWAYVDTIPAAVKTNTFIVSPRDTQLMVAAVGVPDRIVRSSDGGHTWTTTLTVDFGEYGVPLEMNPDHPDTLLFAPEDGNLYRSLDFGATWSVLSSPAFRSPCDLEVVPGDESNVWVADGVTGVGDGEIWRSTDGGLTFAKTYPVSQLPRGSEVPNLATTPHDPTFGLATHWPVGGISATANGGASWSLSLDLNSAWGAEFARDDPDVFMIGTFGSSASLLSYDRGLTYKIQGLPGQNYALYMIDRGTFLAQQSGGVFKMTPVYNVPVTQSQTMQVTAPNGGEVWRWDEPQTVRWSSFNVYLAKIEYRRSPADPWRLVDVVDGVTGRYTWQLPGVPTSQALVRVSDAWDGDPVDVANATFSITVPNLGGLPDSLDLGTTRIEEAAAGVLTIQNAGDAPLVISSITSGDPTFWVGRSSLTLGAGQSDTLGVWFLAGSAGRFTTQLMLETNDPASPHAVTLRARAVPAAFALLQNRPNPFHGTTEIRYALPVAANVTLEIFNVQGQRVATLVRGRQEAGEYTIPFGPGAPPAAGLGSRSLPAGMYFYRLEADGFRVTRKLLLLR